MTHRTLRMAGAALAALVVLAVLWAVVHRAPDVAAVPSTKQAATRQTSNAADATTGLEVEIRLSADGAAEAIPASVRIGLGHVSAEARTRHADWVRSGDGVGAAQVEDLAEVERWLSAPTRREADGTIVVGPIRLPPADRYDLQARSTDELRVYRSAFTPSSVPETAAPHVAAGLQVDIDAGGGEARLQLLRRGESQESALWHDILRNETPAMLAAFDDDGLSIVPRQALAPLPPGLYEAVVRIDGVEVGRRALELKPGFVASLKFDSDHASTAAALATTVFVVPIDARSGVPIPSTRALWRGPAGERTIAADALGRLPLVGVDPLVAQEVEVLLPEQRDATGLPRWPNRVSATLLPEDPAWHELIGTGRELVKRVEIQPLRWVVLEEANIGGPPPLRPYPVFLLQRRDGEAWIDTPSAHFVPQGGRMAVAIESAGTYRVLRADRPWQIHASTEAVVTADPAASQRVRLIGSDGRSTNLAIRRNDGTLLLNHPVSVVGPHRGLPSINLSTDGAGNLRLESANVASVFVEPAGGEGSEFQLVR